MNIQSYSTNHIDALVTLKEGNKLWVTSFYKFPEPQLRDHSWELLKNIGRNVVEDWIVGGDFNEIMEENEK